MRSHDAKKRSSARPPERRAWARLGPLLAALTLAGIVAWLLREPRAGERALHVRVPDAVLALTHAPQPRLPDERAPPLVEPQPWAATSTNSPPAPPEQIPAWQVRPPPPDPNAVRPVDPVAPADPMGNRPPMENPGGVNGSRPPRSGAAIP